eukprot:evm.model.NODE_38104_length_17421_cov_32.336834.5
MGTVASKDKNKKKKGGGGSSGEEGGGDASKNAWYIKMIDEPPGPLYVAYGVKETGEVGGKGMGGLSRT